jgi:exosortase/archaeosortase family protein
MRRFERSLKRAGTNRSLEAEAVEARLRSRRFVLRAGVLAAFALAVYHFPYAEGGWARGAFAAYLRGYARLAGLVIRLFDHQSHVVGDVIAGRFSMQIVKGCDAVDAKIILITAVLAFPAPLRQRLTGIAFGLVFLTGLNVLRLTTLYFVGIYAPSSFELLHLEVWPIAIILAAVACFFGWTRLTTVVGRSGASA